jgi:glycosyltransferase involved in cell wall biosynthesis
VVATRVGGTPDVVEDGADGILVPVGDVEAIAAALERLARDADLRRRLGEHGRERVVPRYRVERLVDDVDALYRELLSADGLPPPLKVRNADGHAGEASMS